MTDEPESLILRILREMRAEMATKSDLEQLKSELHMEFRSEMHSLRADVASDLAILDAKVDRTRKDLSDQIVGLRRAVVEYHTTVVGHGVLISEMEGRLRRVEQHLKLEPEAH
jgi:hypothetical protein